MSLKEQYESLKLQSSLLDNQIAYYVKKQPTDKQEEEEILEREYSEVACNFESFADKYSETKITDDIDVTFFFERLTSIKMKRQFVD